MNFDLQYWILLAKDFAATYWNWPIINANRDVYIGIVLGAVVMGQITRGPLKLLALALGFIAPKFYFAYIAGL